MSNFANMAKLANLHKCLQQTFCPATVYLQTNFQVSSQSVQRYGQKEVLYKCCAQLAMLILFYGTQYIILHLHINLIRGSSVIMVEQIMFVFLWTKKMMDRQTHRWTD